MAIQQLPIQAYFDKQRFVQHGSQDCANWFLRQGKTTKRQLALYPAMGRRHIRYQNRNRMVFQTEPRAIFTTIDFIYIVVGVEIYQYDRSYNERVLTNSNLDRLTGDVWADFLPVGNKLYFMFSADTSNGRKLFVIEETASSPTIQMITDSNAPENPVFIATFGDRFVVSEEESPQFYLSRIGLDNIAGSGFDPNEAFSFASGGSQVPQFASASGRIQQLGVLHNQLYIFTNYQTDIWMNTPSQILDAVFPFKLNTSYNFDYGISDPHSLSIGFGMMAWLGQNRSGLVQFLATQGQKPQSISTQAVNILLERDSENNDFSPFLDLEAEGFLYQYENTIFYRISAGEFFNFRELDVTDENYSLEYNFETQTWHRVIELNGERNRVQKQVYFNGKHLVTLRDDPAIYELSGRVYFNETRNPNEPNAQADDAFLKTPMRYELVTASINNQDYSEFITDYIEIDFVFGKEAFIKSEAPFDNTTFLVTEDSTADDPTYLTTESGEFLITDDSDTPTIGDTHYNALFRPTIELEFSDDGGICFHTADVKEFSQMGEYEYRMRWYELGHSRNRVYRLVCVSSAPIVILGGVQNVRNVSGGAR